MDKEATLISLAMLKVNIDEGKDYLEYLRPFVLDIFPNLDNLITDEIITELLRNKFGLVIPRRTVQIVLQRISKSGVIKKIDGNYIVIDPFPLTNIAKDKAIAERHISAVIEGLIKYFKEETVANKEFNEEIAIDVLLIFLSKFSIPCLKAYLRGTTIPDVPNGKDWKIILVSQYINYLNKNDPERFESFICLVQGHMLANALLCPDLKFATKSFQDVCFYLDTPLLVQLFGLGGEPKKQAVEEMLRLVLKLDGKFACFSHTREELEGVLRRSSDFVNSNQGKGEIILEARRQNISKSDLLLMAEKIDEYLEKYKISINGTPAYLEKFQISETNFANSLDDEVSYKNPKARVYDINSVRSIYVLREGSSPFSIEKCKAVLVTNNTAFSKAAYEFGKNQSESKEISSVITDFSLANIAWLKAPQGAPSLPRKEVLAMAYAGLNSNPIFWEKFLSETEKLENIGKISPRDHQLLRSNIHITDELMKLTLGEENALTAQTITETLSRVTDEIKSEENAKLLEVSKKLEKTTTQLNELKEKEEYFKQSIYWQQEALVRRDARAISIFLGFLLILGLIYGFINSDQILFQICFGFVTIFSFFGYFYGTTVKQIQKVIGGYFLKSRLIKKEKELNIKFDNQAS
ncbi:hypothetical protein [Methylovulum miyakonense]|uniref:hypothetical protein n=1 Tax=Methylovulum miyakonense TaxID=645578 RepID=UPI00037D3E30|nr:hypothetical protein [Methylovulum miyakonense]